MEDKNSSFRHFINWFRIQKIPELFLRYDIQKKERQEYLNKIDICRQGFRIALFLKLPDFMQAYLMRLLKSKHVQWN